MQQDSNSALPIPAVKCERLSQIDGIEASFALKRTNADGSVIQIPGGRASVYSVSPGAMEFLDVEPSSHGVVIATAAFAERTGVSDGEVATVIVRSGETSALDSSVPLEVRVAESASIGDEFDGSLLMPAHLVDEADTCFVRTDAAHHSAVESALPAQLSYDGTPAVVSPRLFESEFTIDYTTAYEDRPLRWLWLPAAALLGLLWALLQWFRRAHIAIYATFGMRASSRLVMTVAEWATLACVGASFGWSIGLVGSLAFGAAPSQALALVSVHTALTLIGATIAVIVLGARPTGTLLSALKDR
ncbi:hypothetical protein [Demequina sp. NBRC 110055]|uniref:hypothetical protein n=1 Tax=Demequina sp. NBRC 110055 TaxID=1570344 RepID=UPI000A05564A|nr:hypothetical protein [Demequina sp. NBRC 110055]